MTKLLSASIASDGTIKAAFRITDLKGLPLDREGVVTPGLVTIRLTAAYIPPGQSQYRNYVKSATTGRPAADSTGRFDKTADGEYVYTFAAKAPPDFDRSATHTVGIQANRDLREFDLGVQVDNDVLHFVPDASRPPAPRDIIRTATCNSKCHDPLAVHGGNRRKVELCILCHQTENVNFATGANFDFPVMVHKIHRGASLPSVVAGGSYSLGTNSDFSDVVFPANTRNCEVCHDPKAGAAQSNAWLTPSRKACGACHDDVNFDTGVGHVGLPQFSDDTCATCHIPKGEIEFDASVRGAHLDPRFSEMLPGTVFTLLGVTGGTAGTRPTVTFAIKDKKGNTIEPSSMDRLALVLSGPATDYTSFVSEDARKAAAAAGGAFSWTFANPIPAAAQGTFAVGIEGYKNVRLLPGTVKEVTVRDAGKNQMIYFSVDGSPVLPRRTVVQVEKCNACHLQLELHGRNRNDPAHCVQCHNVTQTDANGRPAAARPAQSINFKIMIHSIHTGEDLTREFAIYGGSGSKNDFSDVIFPGDRRNCAKCHVNGSEQLPLPSTVSPVNNPRAPYNPLGAVAAACTACHTTDTAYAHALANTTTLGESCTVCHGPTAQFSVNRAHAR